MISRIVLAASALAASAPAAAIEGSAQRIAQVPEASSLMLFVLGVAGVVIGRRLSRSPRD